jgi:hypothetical protein
MPPQDAPDEALDPLTLSSAVAAKLRVLDVSGCFYLRSIDVVRSCVQLRCLWMPRCFNVQDLSPLAACSETLEELWMADSRSVKSLAPLKACTRLRKLGLRSCDSVLHDQVQDLRLACTQLADPASVKIEGLVHDLQPNMSPGMYWSATRALISLAEGHRESGRQRRRWCRSATGAAAGKHICRCADASNTRTAAPGCLPCVGRGCHLADALEPTPTGSLKAARHPESTVGLDWMSIR